MPSAQNAYLFNGDIVDRGGHALEILLLLFCFLRDVPGSIWINRGNHEDASCTMNFGFVSELESKFQEHHGLLHHTIVNSVFPVLPICAIVSDPEEQRRIFV